MGDEKKTGNRQLRAFGVRRIKLQIHDVQKEDHTNFHHSRVNSSIYVSPFSSRLCITYVMHTAFISITKPHRPRPKDGSLPNLDSYATFCAANFLQMNFCSVRMRDIYLKLRASQSRLPSSFLALLVSHHLIISISNILCLRVLSQMISGITVGTH